MYTQHPKLYNVHTEDHFDSIFILSLSHLSVLWSIDIQYKKGGLLVVALLFSNRFHRVTIIYSVEYDPPLGYTSFVCVPIFLVEKNKKIKNGSNQRLFVGLLWFYSSTIFWVISNCCWPVYCRRHPKRFFTDGGTGQRTFCVDRFLAVATGCLLMFPNIQWWRKHRRNKRPPPPLLGDCLLLWLLEYTNDVHPERRLCTLLHATSHTYAHNTHPSSY